MTSWHDKAEVLRSRALPLFVIISATLVVLSPFLSRQLLGTHDLDIHQERLVEFYENVRRGIVFPIWSENAAGGIGRPVFVFVAPLPYYLGSIFLALGLDSVLATHLTMVLAAMVTVTAMYLWAGLVQGRWFGVLAALVLLTSDYFVFDSLERGALAECVAWGPLILVLYFCERYRRQPADRHIVCASLCFAAMVLAHNLTIIMAGPVIILYLGWVFWHLPKPRWDDAWRLSLIPVGGLLISGFFWFPAVYYRSTIHIERPVTGFGEYTRHIVPWSRLLHVHWFFSPGDELNVVGPLFLVGAIVVLIDKGGRSYAKAWLRLCLGLAIITLMMTLPMSIPLWRLVRWLTFLQFPWRWMMLGTLFGSALSAFALRQLPETSKAAGGLVMAGVLATGLGFAYSFGHARSKETHAQKTAADIRAQAKLLDRDDAFQPIWSPEVRGPVTEERLVTVKQGQGSYESTIDHNYREVIFNNSSPTRVLISTAFYPTWQLSLRGAAVEFAGSPNAGMIELALPQGSGRLVLEQKATGVMIMARVTSALTILALLFTSWGRFGNVRGILFSHLKSRLPGGFASGQT